MARIASLVRSAPPPSSGSLAEAKLALLEQFIASEDARECAQRALDWLGQQTSVRCAVCAVRDTDQPRLVALAGLRIPVDQIDAFGLELEEEPHPLADALKAAEPALLPPTSDARRALPEALASAACLAIPLP